MNLIKILTLPLLAQIHGKEKPSFQEIEKALSDTTKKTIAIKEVKEIKEEKERKEYENYALLSGEKDYFGYNTGLLVRTNLKDLIVENLVNYQKLTRDMLLSNFQDILRFGYKNFNAFFSTSQGKWQEERIMNGYYNFQKNREVFNGISGKFDLKNALIMFLLNQTNSNIFDLTKEKYVESIRDTGYDNGITIINDYDITTNTNVSSNFDLKNQLVLFGLGINREFNFKNTKSKLEFILANEINDFNNSFNQIINTHTRVKGNVYLETPYSTDTLAIDEETYDSQNLKQNNKDRQYNVMPILSYEIKNPSFWTYLITNKLITEDNGFRDDWNIALALGLPWAKTNQYTNLISNYNSNGSWSLEGKLYLFKSKENKEFENQLKAKQIEKFNKIVSEIEDIVRENQNIKYKEIYIPENYARKMLKVNEIKELTKVNGLMFGARVNYNALANDKVSYELGLGYGKYPIAVKISFGKDNASILFGYKDINFALHYLKTQIENKTNEKVGLTLFYTFK